MSERPYTPERLAERWECSPQHIYNLLGRGDLHGFKLGGKLWRIAASEVERIECQTTASESSRADLSSSGTRPESAIAGDLQLRLLRMREQRLGSSPANVTRLENHRSE